MLWRSGGLSTISMSVCGYIRIYLAVYGPEIIDGFVLEEKVKNGNGLWSRKNKLWRFAECVTSYNRPS